MFCNRNQCELVWPAIMLIGGSLFQLANRRSILVNQFHFIILISTVDFCNSFYTVTGCRMYNYTYINTVSLLARVHFSLFHNTRLWTTPAAAGDA